MVTGKNKKRFEKWCVAKGSYSLCNGVDLALMDGESFCIYFDELPFEMQKGVYEAYYDSVDSFKIITDYDVNKEDWFVWLLKNQRVRVLMRDDKLTRMSFNTREEAFAEALKQADKLSNEQLTKADTAN